MQGEVASSTTGGVVRRFSTASVRERSGVGRDTGEEDGDVQGEVASSTTGGVVRRFSTATVRERSGVDEHRGYRGGR